MLVLLGILRFAIPDKPINLIRQLSRERQLAKETLYEFERSKSSKGDKESKSFPVHPFHLTDLGIQQGVAKT